MVLTELNPCVRLGTGRKQSGVLDLYLTATCVRNPERAFHFKWHEMVTLGRRPPGRN